MEAVFIAIGTHRHEFASIVVGNRDGDETAMRRAGQAVVMTLTAARR